MNKYQVRITETLERIVEVNAKDWADARKIVRQKYYDEEIVLDSDDYQDVEIEVIWED